MVRFLLLAAVALLAGCGAAEAEPAGEAAPAPAPARLIVREQLPPHPVYIEGSISFLRVEASGGEVVADGPVTDGRQVRGEQPLLDRSLEPGEYRIASHQRPCAGNCGFLDPVTDRCERTVRLEPGATLTATVELAQTGGCAIRVAG